MNKLINFEQRLTKMKNRRQGAAEGLLARVAFESGIDYREHEVYEALEESSGVKYAIGAMSPVDKKYTDVSTEEGARIAKTLRDLLATDGINVTYEMQGSVALDIHIKGHSDVDMLIILSDKLISEKPNLKEGAYFKSADTRAMVDVVAELRTTSEEKLKSRYYEATVGCENSKAIALEGGSLRRKIDVVPSCWYDCHDYQRTGHAHERGIYIYDKREHKLIGNYPFKHIKLINDKDDYYDGNLKKVVRLLKNLIADMPDDKKRVAKKLSSFDLAAIAYHMDDNLNVPSYLGLRLIDATRNHLSILLATEPHHPSLHVPDSSRKIFDNNEKFDALHIITKEIDDLATSIYKELAPGSLNQYDSSTLREKRVFLETDAVL